MAVSAVTLVRVGVGLFASVGVEESIVGLHVVGLNDEVVGGRIAGQYGLGRLAEAASKAGLVTERPHEAGTDGLERERLDDGGTEVGFAVLIEQAQELLDLVAELDSDFRPASFQKPAIEGSIGSQGLFGVRALWTT